MNFHGIDLHLDSLLDATITAENINTVKNMKYQLTGESFKKFKESLSKNDYVIIEPCTNAFWLYDQIKNLVTECYILNTIKYRNMLNKTDKIDTKKLVKKLAYYIIAGGDEDDLPTIFIPAKEVREIRGLFSTYKLNKKIINQSKNRIHSILKENGVYLKAKYVSTKKFKKNIEDLSINEAWKIQVKILFEQLDFTEKKNNEIKNIIYDKGYSLFKKEIELLLTVTGFSPLTAIALMSDAVDINRFKNSKKFCAYLRTAPMVKGSNDKNKIGNTNKASRTLTCSLLSQSITHFSKAGDHLTSFYNRVKKGKKAGVYRMALIRKILVCAYHMLKRKKMFYWVNNELYQKKIKEFKRDIFKIRNNKINQIKKEAA